MLGFGYRGNHFRFSQVQGFAPDISLQEMPVTY
jgi:hypothetical protein